MKTAASDQKFKESIESNANDEKSAMWVNREIS
jgi:hypothetical protein